MDHTSVDAQSGQTTPSGHRSRVKYSRQVCSVGNQSCNSSTVRGYSDMPEKYYRLRSGESSAYPEKENQTRDECGSQGQDFGCPEGNVGQAKEG